jgi:hypothetical protein
LNMSDRSIYSVCRRRFLAPRKARWDVESSLPETVRQAQRESRAARKFRVG